MEAKGACERLSGLAAQLPPGEAAYLVPGINNMQETTVCARLIQPELMARLGGKEVVEFSIPNRAPFTRTEDSNCFWVCFGQVL